MKTPRTDGKISGASTLVQLGHGDYLCSHVDLYYVELVGPERVLLEDCRTGTLLDLSTAAAAGLRRVTPMSQPA